MKILYIVQHFNTPKGSAGLRSYMLAKALIASGHEVTLVCGSYSGAYTGLNGEFYRGKRNGNVEGINIIEFDMPYSNKLTFFSRAIMFVKFSIKSLFISLSTEYDIIFTSSTPLTVAIPGIFAKWLRNKVFVFEIRDLWPELPKAMGVITNPIVLGSMELLEYIAYKSATRLIGLSDGMVEGIKKHGILESKITCIPNGCDLEIFNDKNNSIRRADFNNNDLVCIYSGTHGIANGLDAILLVAEELIKRKVKNIKFVLIGDGKLKENLLTISNDKKLNNIIFLNPVKKKELAELMSSCDIGMQILANIPAFYNGTSPNKFFDYISNGLPILCNYPGWISNLIEKEKCGIFVEPENPSIFADRLISIKKEKIRLKEMSVNSRNLAIKSFNRNDLSKKWVSWVTTGKI